jgi:hypothetical protein
MMIEVLPDQEEIKIIQISPTNEEKEEYRIQIKSDIETSTQKVLVDEI